MSEPREIAPGIVHWRQTHPSIGSDVSSYWIPSERVVLDPLLPPGGIAVLDPAPVAALLTCRHHWRDCSALIEAFGLDVHAPRSGLHEFGADRPVVPYDPGDELPGGFRVFDVDGLSPDESALHHAARRALAIADGVVRIPPDGPLQFVSDGLLGDDPAAVRRDLRAAFGQLAGDLEIDVLLLAHGDPVVGGGGATLAAFAREPEA